MSYSIIIPRPVRKQLDALSNNIYFRVIEKNHGFEGSATPTRLCQVRGYGNEYRIRIGDYRVRYEIRDEELIILLIHCKHRKDIYRNR